MNRQLRSLQGGKANSYLKYLNLSENFIKDVGLKYLLDAIEHHKTLTSLNISRNVLSEEAIKLLGMKLGANDLALESLYIEQNLHDNISTKAFTEFAENLKGSTTLRKLSLNGNNINSETAEKIRKALENNNTLESLTITGQEWQELVNAINAKDEEKALYLAKFIAPEELFVTNDSGNTLLMLSASAGLGKLCKVLIAKNDQVVNIVNKIGHTSLIMSAYGKLEEVSKILITKMNDEAINTIGKIGTALTWAAARGWEDVCEILLEKMNDEAINATGYKNSTALIMAAASSSEEICKILIPRMSDEAINAVNSMGMTALIIAAQEKLVNIYKMLIPTMNEKSINAIPDVGPTAAFLIVNQRLEEESEMIINKMTDETINFMSFKGNTILTVAAKAGLSKICEILIARMSDEAINTSNDESSTALTWAVNNNMENICAKLIVKASDEIIDNLIISPQNENIIKIVMYAKAASAISQGKPLKSEVKFFSKNNPPTITLVSEEGLAMQFLKEDSLELKNTFIDRLKNKLMQNGLPEEFKTYKEFKEFILTHYSEIIPTLLPSITNKEGTGVIDGLEEKFNEKASSIDAELLCKDGLIGNAMSYWQLEKDVLKNPLISDTENSELLKFYNDNPEWKIPSSYLTHKLASWDSYPSLVKVLTEFPHLVDVLNDLNNKIETPKAVKVKVTQLLKEYEKSAQSIKQQQSIESLQDSGRISQEENIEVEMKDRVNNDNKFKHQAQGLIVSQENNNEILNLNETYYFDDFRRAIELKDEELALKIFNTKKAQDKILCNLWFDAHGYNGDNILHYIAYADNPKILKTLYNYNKELVDRDLKEKNTDNMTPVEAALYHHNFKFCEELATLIGTNSEENIPQV